jgi:hypothetical protein
MHARQMLYHCPAENVPFEVICDTPIQKLNIYWHFKIKNLFLVFDFCGISTYLEYFASCKAIRILLA